MNCLIVDDNLIARTVLKQMVSMDPDLNLVGECENAVEAYKMVLTHQIDVLFLDVEMPGMSGIELVQSLEGRRPMIIFTTGTTDYAAVAFDLNVVDFLIKPILPVRFLQAIEKARELYRNKNTIAGVKEDEFIFIRDSSIVRRLKVSDILYLEAKGDYVKINVPNQVYNIHSSLKSVEQKLSPTVFLRVHRSFIVNVSKIDTIEGGTLIINNMMVPVSDAFRASLNKRMQIL